MQKRLIQRGPKRSRFQIKKKAQKTNLCYILMKLSVMFALNPGSTSGFIENETNIFIVV